jgi:hypothetical protein
MGYEFTGGTTKVIQLTAGTTILDVKDMYSRWKDWVLSGGSKCFCAFASVGGDPIDVPNGVYVTSYLFLLNGWRVRPQESSHTLKVQNGVLLTNEGDDPFIPTQGTYNVQIKYSQPIRTETIVTETGVSGLTSEESDQLMKVLTVAKFLGLK